MTRSSLLGPLPGLSRRAIATLPLLGLAACAFKPAGTASGIATPARFDAADPLAPARWPAPSWWHGFGSGELDQLMALALRGNTDIAVAVARMRQADAQVRIAGGALLPTADLSLGGQRAQARNQRTSNSFSAQVSASYEIDFWGKNANNLEAARRSAAASAYNAAAVMLTVQASVATTYFTLLGSQEQLAIGQDNLAIAERSLSILRSRRQFGTATGLDLAQQETVAAQQRANIPGLIRTVEQNRTALATLTGQVPQQVHPQGGGFNEITVPEIAPGQPAELLARRPDVLAAEANLAAAQADIAAARAALFPSLTLDLSAGFSASRLASLMRPESQLFSLAGSVLQPIFRGGALRGAVQLSQAQAEELLASYRAAIIAALVDVEDSLTGLNRSTEQTELQRAAVESAQRAFTIAEAQFRAGTIDLLTLLNTQQTLFSVRNSLIAARLERLSSAVSLFRALGGGWVPQP
ncbi:efflux transporter outer membrane subunit [Acetobacteraceae bacterium H6797]|nr:efflux transporter outer membrane subunit [Acetobacteraceae bacterium H6797]